MSNPRVLQIKLRNHTASNTVFCYITGTDIARNTVCLLQADGHTLFYPRSPSAPQQPLGADCAITLPLPGRTRNISIPTYLAGGRIWFSVNERLTFKINPGPALVEPSVLNSSDPNINKRWDFCEFTHNSAQLFANISYVDFFSMPIALTLYPVGGGAGAHVSGTDQNGLVNIAAGVRTQSARDGKAWNQLVVPQTGAPLRVLSPNSAISRNSALFANYFDAYVDQVWTKYDSQALTINTQNASFGNVNGRVVNGRLQFGGASFARPSSHDIFSCSTGPFVVPGPGEAAAIIPRLAAAFNRSTLLTSNVQPDGVDRDQFYQNPITNHYARVCHNNNLDRRGYAFPYDDVTRDGGLDQSGSVMGPARLFIIAVGGRGAGLPPAPENDETNALAFDDL